MDNKELLETAKDAARAAGAFIKDSVGRISKIEYKTDSTNIVTDVDSKAEQIVIDKLLEVNKDFDVLAEESGERNKKSDYKWIIDPIDGTTNFAHSFPFFCVSIALEYIGEIVLGVVYEPIRDEMFYAIKGMGAYLNDKQIFGSKVVKIGEALLATGFAYDLERKNELNISNFAKFLGCAQAVRRAGSAALDISYVACGRFDGYWERGLNAWDTAAGFIIACEAGCLVSKFDGSEYSVYDKEILVANKYIYEEMLKTLK